MLPSLSFAAGSLGRDQESVRRMAYEAHDNLKRLYDFFQQLTEHRITDANGLSVSILGMRPQRAAAVAPTEWFSVHDISAGAPRVRVVEGRILVPDTSGIGSDPPVVTGLLIEQTVTGADLDVEDGTKICLKLTATHPAAAIFEVVGEDDDFVSVTVSMEVHRIYATAGEIVALTTVPAPTDTESHVTLAEISITDGVMTIKQRHNAAVTAPAIITPVLKTVSVTSALATVDYWTCNAGTATEVTFIVPA